MKKRGFTLIEIVLVIALIAILSITMAVKWTGFEEAKLTSAVSKLAADIAYAQQLAITTQLFHGLSFDTTNEKYSLFRIEADGTPTTIEDPYRRGEAFVVEYPLGELQGVTLQSVNIEGGDQLLFNWQGTPCDSSGTELTSDATITLECKGNTKTLTVVAETGKVTW
ncbi:MAG: prepilin-type N-terminal cleavage/methylation domain-containing protein [Candidatus Omnitrophota bacterium]